MVPLPIHRSGCAFGAQHSGGPPEPVAGALQRAQVTQQGAAGAFARSHAAMLPRDPLPDGHPAETGAPQTDAQRGAPRRSHGEARVDTGAEGAADTPARPGTAPDEVRARTAARLQTVPRQPGTPETAPAAARPPQGGRGGARASAPGPDQGGGTAGRASPARASAMPAAAGHPVPGAAQPAAPASGGREAAPGAMAPAAGRGGDAVAHLPPRSDHPHTHGAEPTPGAKPAHGPERDLSRAIRFAARMTAPPPGARPPFPRGDGAQSGTAEDAGTGDLRPGRPASTHPDRAPHGHDPVLQTAPETRTASATITVGPVQAAGGFDAARLGAAVADPAAPASETAFGDDPDFRPHGSADTVRADTPRPELARHAAGQVVAAIRAAGATATASGPPGSFGIDLSPAELGRVRISMSVSETGLMVTVLAERAETQDLLRRHIDHLRDMLADTGHASIRFDFGGGGRAWQGSAHPDPDTAHGSNVAAIPDAAQASLHRTAAMTEGSLDMRL